ncbi:hypothetical protein [Parasitella parasitica]|uniref:F-box domain-containing protein n=1 Tax=Parasitella parasitica TaxID=35722 RepID=A0A0B7NQM7_9FUNG|nr:hypothetical protein [Parasitella parasitica]
MESLPKETFLMIQSYLEIHTKIECLVVCRKWYDWIKSDSLYSKLTFDNEKRLERAIRFLYHQKCKQSVKQLEIRSIHLPVLLMSTLPDAFPNLKQLTIMPFDNADEDQFALDDLTNLLSFDLSIQKWKSLEKISETHHLPITVSLLKSPIPTRLTSIKLTYAWDSSYSEATEASYVGNYFKVQSLINYLHNAPFLESLELSNIYLTLKNMENLHANTPNLKELHLNKMMLCLHTEIESVVDDVYVNSTKNGVIIEEVASNIKNITFSTMDNITSEDELNDAAILKWIEYSGRKYTGLNAFCFYRALDDTTSPTGFRLEKPLKLACRNWHYLQSYDTNICPLSIEILKEFDDHSVQLNHLGISGNRVTLEEQLLFVQVSDQAKHLNSLKIRYSNDSFHHQKGPNHKWISIISVFRNLHTLDVSSRVEQSEYEIDMLPMVLRQVPTLKNFTIGRMLANVKAENTPKLTQPTLLEHLSITRCGITNDKELSSCNAILNNVVLYSPNLAEFIFETDGYYDNRLIHCAKKKKTDMALELDFKQQVHLKNMEINFEESHYYKIYDSNDKGQWYYQKQFLVGQPCLRVTDFKKIPGLPHGKPLYTKIYLGNNKALTINSKKFISNEFVLK